MNIFGILFILAILIVWLYAAFAETASATQKTGWKRLRSYVASFLVAVGATGFFGSALSASGGLDWLPKSFEWPAGFADGVVSTVDNFFVVPLPASGRVQVYDANWRFVRGWRVAACAGTFRLYTSDRNIIHVVTARGQWHYTFDIHGNLLSTANYAPNSYDSFPKDGASHAVPTPPWLWVFTSPLYSWLVAGIGVALLATQYSDKAKRCK